VSAGPTSLAKQEHRARCCGVVCGNCTLLSCPDKKRVRLTLVRWVLSASCPAHTNDRCCALPSRSFASSRSLSGPPPSCRCLVNARKIVITARRKRGENAVRDRTRAGKRLTQMKEGEVLLDNGNVRQDRWLGRVLAQQGPILGHVSRRVHQGLQVFELSGAFRRNLFPSLLHSAHSSITQAAARGGRQQSL